MNPHKKETGAVYYLGETYYRGRWYHNTDLWVEADGLALIICTISFSITNHANIGFRLVDENNEPLPPFRVKTNDRIPAHFTAEINTYSDENLSHITFHMIVNCKCVKLQISPDDSLNGSSGAIMINKALGKYINGPAPDRPWSHKPICTMTAIPLLPHYQGGANTVFTYPKPRTRIPRMPDRKTGISTPVGPS